MENTHKLQSWQQAQACLDEGRTLALEVTGSNRGGLLVAFEEIEGFVPNSHIPAIRKIHNPERILQEKRKMYGKTVHVKAIEVSRDRKRLIFSIRKAQQDQAMERLSTLEVGDEILGKVVNVVHFGVFVDLDGIDGLVHISELDWENVPHPSNITEVGDEILVKVIEIDKERKRVSLSRKALLPNPWDDILTQYVPGSLVAVEIVKLVDFGAFARLPEGIHGLIHKSEFIDDVPGNNETRMETGMKVLTKILRINPQRKRIALSMRRVPSDRQVAWMTESEDEALEPEGT